MSRYRWEPGAGAAGHYRDTTTGRYVTGAAVRRELDAYLVNSDTAARGLAQALRGRQISLADWELGMRRHIKNVQLNAIAMERGGWANMRPQDYGRAGQIVREQYGYLRNFARQIEHGELQRRGMPLTEEQKAIGVQRLDGTLDRRAQLYTQAGRTEGFYRSKRANLQPGVDMVRSIKHARDSCRGCVDMAGRWFPVGDPSYVPPGRRECNKNCACTEEYGRSTPDGEPEVVEAA